ncbi:IS6 family transposase [Janthinobacterium sp. PSPC1-1]|uniref:IS6 family transposase n=1 Tax=Janthinobacterium sp. PSPC1-1 TaxID=2804581 RepID=UPI003CF55EE5
MTRRTAANPTYADLERLTKHLYAPPTDERAVDQNGHVIDILMQSRRNRQAANSFFRKLLKGLRYTPGVLITDKLKSYAAAKTQIMLGVEHRQHKGLNNRAELSHQPTRQRERQMRRFESSGQAQRFLSAHGPINNTFRCQRNRLTADRYRHVRMQAFFFME